MKRPVLLWKSSSSSKCSPGGTARPSAPSYGTWRFGELVGEDEQGNRYYRTAGRKIDPTLGFERRWVVYNGYAEATRIPPSWHGWIHHTVDVAPTEENYTPREWAKPHVPNMTGPPNAYRPSGSTLASGRRPKATGDYQPWTPGN